MGRFRIRQKPVKDPIEEAFKSVWRVGGKNDFRMLPPEYQSDGRSGNQLLSALRDGRREIQLALARTAVPQMKNEPTMDLFSGEAAVPFTLLRLGAVPHFTLVDWDEAYERKCTAIVRDFRLADKVDFLRRQIGMAMPLPETRQVTIISTGIGLPQALRGKGTSSFSETLFDMLEEGPGEFIRRFAANSRHLHISSVELHDVLLHLSEAERRVVIVDQPDTNIPNLGNAVREHITAELEGTDGYWRHTFTAQQDDDGTIVSELTHE